MTMDSGERRFRIPLEAMLAEAAGDEASRAVLVFEAGGEVFGLDAAAVEAVVARVPVTRLPYAPAGVVGVASVRGRMRLVVDPGGCGEAAPRLIALHGDAQLAVLADVVAGVVTLPPGDLPSDFSHAGRDVTIVDPESLVGEG